MRLEKIRRSKIAVMVGVHLQNEVAGLVSMIRQLQEGRGPTEFFLANCSLFNTNCLAKMVNFLKVEYVAGAALEKGKLVFKKLEPKVLYGLKALT